MGIEKTGEGMITGNYTKSKKELGIIKIIPSSFFG